MYNVQVEKSGVKLNLLVAGAHYFLSLKGPGKHRDMFVSFIGAQEDVNVLISSGGFVLAGLC